MEMGEEVFFPLPISPFKIQALSFSNTNSDGLPVHTLQAAKTLMIPL